VKKNENCDGILFTYVKGSYNFGWKAKLLISFHILLVSTYCWRVP
jgi:hypothetical protein